MCFFYLQVYSLKYIIILVKKDGEAFNFYKWAKHDYSKIVKKKKDNFLIEIFCLYVTEVSTSVSKNDQQ